MEPRGKSVSSARTLILLTKTDCYGCCIVAVHRHIASSMCIQSEGCVRPQLRNPAVARCRPRAVHSGLDGARLPQDPHVWTAPGLSRETSTSLQRWSEQPCVRPFDAVHMTAGHNALRGSGPYQLHAFDNARGSMGCPDHRIDRFCITCCQPFPTASSRRCRRDFVLHCQATSLPINGRARPARDIDRPWPSTPRPFSPACWQVQLLRP